MIAESSVWTPSGELTTEIRRQAVGGAFVSAIREDNQKNCMTVYRLAGKKL